MHNFTEYVNPHLGSLLEKVKMDKVFTRGEGNYLYDCEGRRYLDFIAAYGALPFGFNPPEIWEVLEEARRSGLPSFIQPSALEAAGELARLLVENSPPSLRYVTFTNSGAEAVEAAIKMARSATGRMGILSTDGGFHGKTMGALSATARRYYQEPFGAPISGFSSIPYGDLEALQTELDADGGEYAAFIVEPIQGEGGIVVPPSGYLAGALKVCREHGVLFILDEIQTGLGRTGSLFACEDEGIDPDVILLAKALGGGLFPIGACLSSEAAYNKDFGDRHSSTFAGNTLGCLIGIKVMEMLARDDRALLRQVRENGESLRLGLLSLKDRYPRVLRGVRGRGLMLGLDFFMERDDFPNCLLGVLSEQESLTPLISSYLLNIEGLRVAPTLNGNTVIRIEPPLITTRDQCEAALSSLERVLEVLDQGNTVELLRPVLGLGDLEIPAYSRPEGVWKMDDPPVGEREGRFAFLVHPLDLYNYPEFDPALAGLPLDKLRLLAELGSDILEPFIIGRTSIDSLAGYKATGDFIALPFTAAEMTSLDPGLIMNQMEKALKLARKRGARLVGLGAYTSVVSRGGTLVQGRFLPLTTGNSYTVVASAEAVKLAAEKMGLDLGSVTAAVVGATGSIGRAMAILLSEEMERIILVGNARHPNASARRLRRVGADLGMHLAGMIQNGWQPPPGSIGDTMKQLDLPGPEDPPEDWLKVAESLEKAGRLVITTDLNAALPLSQVVITATSSTEELIKPALAAPGAIICDISRPPNVDPDLRKKRPDVLTIDGGVVEVPGRPSLGWDFGFERGLSYACMAETMMLALEHHYSDMSLGTDLSLDNMVYLRKLAQKHGFRLAQLRSFDQPLDEEEWQETIRARTRLINVKKLGMTL